MSGHSKWSTIKRKKEKTDSARAKVFTKIGREISVAVKSGGDGNKNDYETVVYEGYGPEGIALIVETLTDNRNRTASNLRHYFDKFGGNLGTTGCVAFMFEKKGVIVIDAASLDEEAVMGDCLESGAEDFEAGDGVFTVTTAPNDFSNVRERLEQEGYTFLSAQVEMLPSNMSALKNEENKQKMSRLLEALDEDDDVQEVWNNLENIEDLP